MSSQQGSQQEAPSAGRRILVVDDEETVCRSCKRIFEAAGFAVDTSTDSQQGLKMAQEGDYSAILLDIKMPDLSGIRFLERLRRSNQDVPVVIITGYPSRTSAAAAERLGAADYLNKPFTREEVVQAVTRSIAPASKSNASDPRQDRRKSPEAFEPWQPVCEDFDFLDDAWLQVGRDGTARVGLFPRRAEIASLASLELPILGEMVYRGLPLAAFRREDGSTRTFPSPISGEVVDVNRELAGALPGTWDDPCHLGWVARLKPLRIIRDMWACSTRSVVLLSLDEGMRELERCWLEHLGCTVLLASTFSNALRELRETESSLLVVDARSFGSDGPGIVAEVNRSLPDVKVVVVAGVDRELESAYRSHEVMRYITDPLQDADLVDTLADAFIRRPPEPEPSSAALAAEWIDRIRVTNPDGTTASLLSTGRLLPRFRGVAPQLVSMLKESRRPFAVRQGDQVLSAAEILAEAHQFDRLLVLKRPEKPRLPASMSLRAPQDEIVALDGGTSGVLMLEIEPNAAEQDQLVFDSRTCQAVAEHILAELTHEA